MAVLVTGAGGFIGSYLIPALLERGERVVAFDLPEKPRNLAAVWDEITYVQGGEARRVKARKCILACYLSVIPHLCPELPKVQKEALGRTIRMPLVSVNVLVSNWKAFEKLRIYAAYCPGSYFSDVRLTYPLRFEDYESARTTAASTASVS